MSWLLLFFEIGSAYTSLEFQDVFLYKLKTRLVEPSTWMRICFSLDFFTGNVTLVLNGELVETKKGNGKIKTNQGNLKFTMEHYLTGKLTNLNMFSPELSENQMKRRTLTKNEECASPGNLLDWENATWNLYGKATKDQLEAWDGPCWKKKDLIIFQRDFKNMPECMDHCKTIGGRSPPVRTLKEWQNLETNLDNAIPNTMRPIWLAVKRDGKYDEWKDYYTEDELGNFTRP